MFFAGFISGLLGIGSGALKVLGMDWAMNLPMKVSTTTSNFMIGGVTAATGSALYWYFGYIQPMMAAVTAIGVLIGGAMSGTKILVRITNKQVRWVFLAILAFLGMEMLLKGLYMDHVITIAVTTQYLLSVIFTVIVMTILYYRYGILMARKERRTAIRVVEMPRQDMDYVIGLALRYGVIISIALILIGVILFHVKGEALGCSETLIMNQHPPR